MPGLLPSPSIDCWSEDWMFDGWSTDGVLNIEIICHSDTDGKYVAPKLSFLNSYAGSFSFNN